MLARLQVDGSGNVTGQHAGFRLGSHFQPIFSLSHGWVVGQEALLRATDAQGEAIAPARFFGVPPDVNDRRGFDELLWRDRLARTLHSANCMRTPPQAQWLFLNLHAQVFLRVRRSIRVRVASWCRWSRCCTNAARWSHGRRPRSCPKAMPAMSYRPSGLASASGGAASRANTANASPPKSMRSAVPRPGWPVGAACRKRQVPSSNCLERRSATFSAPTGASSAQTGSVTRRLRHHPSAL